jgi:hypothetical protein
MEKAKLSDITFDEEDTALFNVKGDFLLKAKAIKYSILPKLNVILEETLSRIRKIYDIEVFNQNSIIHSAPNFREKRKNDLKIEYTYAFWGLGASRLPIWEGFERIDNKPAKIIPYIMGYYFDNYGLSLSFNPLRYDLKYKKDANEIFINFLLDNIDYIQTIQNLTRMFTVVYSFDNKNVIRPFREILEDCKNQQIYDISFSRIIKCPIDYFELNLLIDAFVMFFPIYYSLLEIAQNKKCSFKDIISKINFENMSNDYLNNEIKTQQKDNENILLNFEKKIFVKAGIRWQVFERDDFKCVACGKSAHEGAILHVDHIIPRSKGGSDSMDNYQTLCHLCNIGKSNKSDRKLRI